jgi:hypothetical protein
VTGFEGDTPYNFNWVSVPGKTKQGPRDGVVSPHHITQKNDFLKTAEFCGMPNREEPYDTWVITHLEPAARPASSARMP